MMSGLCMVKEIGQPAENERVPLVISDVPLIDKPDELRPPGNQPRATASGSYPRPLAIVTTRSRVWGATRGSPRSAIDAVEVDT